MLTIIDAKPPSYRETKQITSVVKCHFSTGRAGNVEIIIMAKRIFEAKSCRNNSRELPKKKVAKRKTRKMRENFAGTRKVRKSRKKKQKEKLNQIPICQEFVQF